MVLMAAPALLMHCNSLPAWSILAMPKSGLSPCYYDSPPAQLENWKSAGVSIDMVRLSVGIEHIDDLLPIWNEHWLKFKAFDFKTM